MFTKATRIAAVAMFTVLACGRGTKQSSVTDNMINNNAPVTLQVTNDNPQDVDVFATGGSRSNRQRLGMVTSGQTQTFTVPSTVARSSSFRLIVHPIGGGGDYSTGTLNINPGDELDLHVAPVVTQTSYMVAQRTN